MKPNGHQPPVAPTILGSPGSPITDAELLRLMERYELAILDEQQAFRHLKLALANYDAARTGLALAFQKRDARMVELADQQAKGRKP